MKNILLLVILIGAVSCKSNMSSQATAQATTSTGSAEGGADIGGSNDFLGKPMESYITDVTELSEYKEFIDPIFKKLDQKLPRFSKSLKSSIEGKRTWYLLPGKLQSIPNFTIAFPFLNSTEQYALHSEKSIWISADKRENISNDLKATHILHEMVMAIKVDGNLRLRKVEDKDFVTKIEYDEIRALVHLLMNDLDNYSSEKLHAYLKTNRFYGSHETLDMIPMHPYESQPVGFQKFSTPKEFFSHVDSVRFAKSYKRYGLPEPDRNLKVEPNFCTYELDLLRKLTVNVFDPSGKPNESGSIEFSELVDYEKTKTDLSIRFISESNQMAHAYYLGNDLLYIEIYNISKPKDPTDQAWKVSGYVSGYTLCVNRGLE